MFVIRSIRSTLPIIAIIVFCAVARSQTVTLVDPGVDNRIATISGLTIGGVNYDATFHHGTQYRDLPVENPITFGGNSAFDFTYSAPAAEAIAAAVSTVSNVSNPTVSALVPAYEYTGNRVSLSWIPFQPNYSNWEPSDVVGAYTRRNYRLPDDYAWVTFEEAAAAVPEPSGLITALGLLAIGTMVRRRRPEAAIADTTEPETSRA